MLPTFEINGLRCCATDSTDVSDDSFSEIEGLSIGDDGRSSTTESGAQREKWADVQLEKKEQYDSIIKEHPEAQLAYVDEEDGDTITVCPRFFVMVFTVNANEDSYL